MARTSDNVNLDFNQMSITPRGHPLLDRADYLRRTNIHNDWKPRDKTEMWASPFKGEVFTDNTRKQLTKKLIEHFDHYCYKCGHFSHKGEHCLLYKNNLAYTLCTRCKQGFHTKCESMRPDLLFKEQKLAQAASLNPSADAPTRHIHMLSSKPSELSQIKQTLEELSNSFKEKPTQKGKTVDKLQKQVTSNESKLKALEEAQTKNFAQLNELMVQLCQQQSLQDTAPT